MSRGLGEGEGSVRRDRSSGTWADQLAAAFCVMTERSNDSYIPWLVNLAAPTRPVRVVPRLLAVDASNGCRQAELPKPGPSHVCRGNGQEEGWELHDFKPQPSPSLGDPACPDIAHFIRTFQDTGRATAVTFPFWTHSLKWFLRKWVFDTWWRFRQYITATLPPHLRNITPLEKGESIRVYTSLNN